MRRVLVSPLSWGLGHATRDLPIIRYLMARGHAVTVAAEGRALALLEQEVPECEFVELKDYPAPYSHTPLFVAKFLAMGPVLVRHMAREARNVRRLLARRRFDLIISDNRFNVCSRSIPSFFISHQLRFATPLFLKPLEYAAELFNYYYFHEIFERVIVPDYPDRHANLAGRLCHDLTFGQRKRIYYAGVLASVRRLDVEQDVDIFFSISGPEPQRTQLERLVLEQVRALDAGRIVIALGKPEAKETRHLDDRITVHGFLGREQQQEMLNRARLVVCRSGYTTVMELAELGKKALFIPTPGQTEQEYLGRYYARRGYFHCASQYRLDLRRDIEQARRMKGLPFRSDTQANVERLYRDLFAPVLD